ncbi:unnamed protein product [Caenorhabditis brenneri]
MNRPKGKSAKKQSGYFPTKERFWEIMRQGQRGLEMCSIMSVMLVSSALMTQAFMAETWDFHNQRLIDIVIRYIPLMVVCGLMVINVYISKAEPPELREHLHNCFGKASFEVVLVVLIHAFTQNVYYAMLYGLYGTYATYIFIRYNYPEKKEVIETTEDEKKAINDVLDRIKSRFPTSPKGSSLARNRKIKRVKRH